MKLSGFDGVYRLAGEHEGWPRFESAAGNHLYRCVPKGVWSLNTKCDPDNSGWCQRVTADGALPEGAVMWKCWVGKEHELSDGVSGFAQVEVTLSLQ